MSHEIEYYVVGIRPNRNDSEAHIKEALIKNGLNPSLVRKIDDPSILPQNITNPPEESPFKGPFQHLLRDDENPLHPIIHALEEGGGRALIADIEQRGNGVSSDFIKKALKGVLRGHVFIDSKDPKILVCPYFTPKEGC